MTNEQQAVASHAEPETELTKLRRENDMLRTAGIIEVAIRNPSVADYMNHWEGRALKAEAALEAAQPTDKAALPAAEMLAHAQDWKLGAVDRRTKAAHAWCDRAAQLLELAAQPSPVVPQAHLKRLAEIRYELAHHYGGTATLRSEQDIAYLLSALSSPVVAVDAGLCQGMISGYIGCELQDGHDGPHGYNLEPSPVVPSQEHEHEPVRAADRSDAVQRQDLRENPDTKGSK